jgi:hypothetical protein
MLTYIESIQKIWESLCSLVSTENAASTSTPSKGIAPLFVRNDVSGTLVDTDGDMSRGQLGENGDLKTGDIQYKQRLAYSGANVEYVGEALPGADIADPVWRIKKLTYSGSNVIAIDWAEGDSTFTHIWSDGLGIDYTTYSYS